MSYYPEGVTGNEDEIAGPRSERDIDEDVACTECGYEGSAIVTELVWADAVTRNWTCEQCEYEHEEEVQF